MRHLGMFLLAVPLALTTACSGVQRVPPAGIALPSLRLESVQPEQADTFGVTLRLVGQMENPNPAPLSVSRFTYAVEVEGKRVTKGKVPSGLALPASGTAPVSIPARIAWEDVPKFLKKLGARPSLPVRVSGGAIVAAGKQEFEVPYSIDGSVAVPKPPVLVLEQAVMRKAGILDNVVELKVTVQNPNPFPLPKGSLNYDLWLAGVSVKKELSSMLEPVPASGSLTTSLSVGFGTLNAGLSALSGKLSGKPYARMIGHLGFGIFDIAIEVWSPLIR